MKRDPLFLLSISIIFIAVIPALFMQGMFQDGTLYATISRNYAVGTGTLFRPYLSETYFPLFRQQPPLMFFLQGTFFQLVGDHTYTERIYCALLLAAWCLLLLRCWKLLDGGTGSRWSLLLIWIAMPVTCYAFINNLEEVTMGVFILAAFAWILKATKNEKVIAWQWMIAGLFILLAGLTKGIQGMFLLSAPFFTWIILKKGNVLRFFIHSLLVAAPTLLFVFYAWSDSMLHGYFADYFRARLVNTFSQTYSENASHFLLLKELLLYILPSIGIMCFIFILTRSMRISVSANEKRMFYFLLCFFLSGSLPLMVTLEQRGFYLFPSLAFLSMALAWMMKERSLSISEKLKQLRIASLSIKTFTLLIILATVILTNMLWGKPKREAGMLSFLNRAETKTGSAKMIHISSSLETDWTFINYAQRFHSYSVTGNTNFPSEWCFVLNTDSVPSYCGEKVLAEGEYTLYRVK